MGCDKALLKTPAGQRWLERTLDLLATVGAPITLISGHPDHLRLAEAWGMIHCWSVQLLDEPAPREGPLLALERLMAAHPDDYLFVAPVDLPNLEPTGLQTLLAEAAAEPQTITLASDGSQLQPLLGLYPPSAHLRQTLCQSLETGNRSLKGWLAAVPHRSVLLPTDQLLNINSPAELQSLTP
jgi:molybdopterin-guanine dinucleotide biosynthesis protein A